MSHAAAMLEMFGVPYLGHDPITTSILDSKHLFKRELALLVCRPRRSWLGIRPVARSRRIAIHASARRSGTIPDPSW